MLKKLLQLFALTIVLFPAKAQTTFNANNRFEQLESTLPTPNTYRTASGSPGKDYWQQRADYDIKVELDDINRKIIGTETITYFNNSPDELPYIWIQLDQNIFEKGTIKKTSATGDITKGISASMFEELTDPREYGYKITAVKDIKGNPLKHTINQTMMRIDLPTPIKSGGNVSFSIDWNYLITEYYGRSGYELFPKDGNANYFIAHWFPRLAVYNDVYGWQHKQFIGQGEFTLNFGNYKVAITVPNDHVVGASGELQNASQLMTASQLKRWEQAKTAVRPVVIVTQAEAEKAERNKPTGKKTWIYKADNVRDFAFASSRKFIWDAMQVDVEGKKVWAMSYYPKEGNPLWEDWSTKVVASTLKSYSKYTFDYPYHKAISVHAKNQGMEYPMICWNYGRPEKDGTYSDRVKYGMMSVIIHEVGHNFFPMIVNSDERQWGWMDEGLDTFMQYLAEQEFGEAFPEALGSDKEYPSRRGKPSAIVSYMAGDQSTIAPIMSNPENVYQLGPNAYAKPATALNILRETVMGRELFDKAFKTYAQRWMFKHPTPEDFFRTMEDASAVDLDYFWRGWFYSTDYVDMGVKGVKKYYVTDKPTAQMKAYMKENNLTEADLPPLVYLVDEASEDFDPSLKGASPMDSAKTLNEFVMDALSAEERAALKNPKYFYEVSFEKPGGIPMPLIVEYSYADGTKETIKYPAEIWRKNDLEVKRVVSSEKEIVGIVVDPLLETADIDTSNNSWPKKETKSEFDQFKQGIKN